MGRVVWVSRYHAPRVSFGAWGGLARVAACLRYACERFACARFSFVLFGRAPLAAWVYDGGVYGGYPVSSCYEAPARPVAGGVRIAPVSYAPSARGGRSASGRDYQSFDGFSLLALLFGLLSLVAGVGFSPCACMLTCGRCVFFLVFCLRTRCICFIFLVGSNFRLPASWLDRPARRAHSRGFGGSAYNGRVVDGRVIFSCSA